MDQRPTSALGRGKTSVWVVLVVLGLAGLGWLVRARLQQDPPLLPAPPARQAEAAPTAAEAELADAEADAAFAADAGLPPEVTRWLAQPGMVRLVAAAVWQVSEGESPREPLRFLAPGGPFVVETRDGRTFMSAQSTARYDALAQTVGAVDAALAGALYGRTRRFLDAAFRGISPPGATFEGALDKALARLGAVPLADAPLEVLAAEQGAGYRFADPALEQLDPAQKHLLRLGPANARVVLSQLRAFRQAAQAQ